MRMNSQIESALEDIVRGAEDLRAVLDNKQYNKIDFIDLWLSENLSTRVDDLWWLQEDNTITLDELFIKARKLYKVFKVINLFKMHYLSQSIKDVEHLLVVGGISL